MINATGNKMTQEIRRQSGLAQAIAEKQVQIATGKRTQRASDDPVATSRVATIRTVQSNDEAYSWNIGFGIASTAQADGQLRQMSDLVSRARELVVSAGSGALSPADRNSVAAEINALASEIDTFAQTRNANGSLLFAQGPAVAVRFDQDVVFAAVPSQSEVFENNGVAISQMMRDAASAVSAGDAGLTGTALTAMNQAIDHVADVSAKVGVNAARLNRMQDAIALRGISLSEDRSRLEDTDLSSAIAELNGMTLTLEAAQAAFGRINRRTLMDFLN